MSIDPGRLPFKPLMKDAERGAEAKAELYRERHPHDSDRTDSSRGLRRALRRLQKAIKRRG